MTDAAVQADVLTPTTTEAETPSVEVKETPELPEGDKPQDDADKPAEQDKLESTEAEKIKHAMQKRIDKQTAARSELERKLAEAEKELLKFRQPVSDTGKPKEEDYTPEKGGYEAYLKDLGKWEAKEEQRVENENKAKADRDAAYQRTMEAQRAKFVELEAELKKVTPDYDEKIAEVEQAIILLTDSQKSSVEFSVFRDMLFSSENMPALTYELGKNPDLLDKMLTINPMQIARQIARLELQIENAPKQQHQPVKAPPSPISGQSSASKDPKEMEPEEYMAWRNKQLKRKT